MKIIVGNLTLNYTDQGKGSVVVMLHGWAQRLGTFDDLAASLVAAGYRVIRLDLPGFGDSERPRQAWGVLDYVKVVRNLLNRLGIEQPVALLGHSFGGRIAIKAVSSGIIKPKKLLLLNSGGINSSNSVRNLSFLALAKIGKVVLSLPFMKPLRKPLRRRLYALAGATDYYEAGVMRDTFLTIIHEDLRDEAKKIRIPTLFLWGRDDAVTPLSDMRLLSNRVSASVVKVLSDAGHFSYQDQPEATAKLVTQFLH